MDLLSRSQFVSNMIFPRFNSRRVYMATTEGANVCLPQPIEAYNHAVQLLCSMLGYKGKIHVTVDEKNLEAGQTHRKPELHVDGRFMGMSWGHSGWNHTCNEIPLVRMSVAVASSLARCKVYNGDFVGTPSEQGDLSHIRGQVGEGALVPANEWHLLSPDCVHESLPVVTNSQRSFIRVAFEDDLL